MSTHDHDPARAAWLDELTQYRAARQQRIQSEWGWLSLVARFVLSAGDNPIDVGTATFVDGDIEVRLARDVDARDDAGQRISTHRWPAGGKDGGPYFFVGARRYEVLRQGDRAAIRVRDNTATARTQFPGLRFFAPDARFNVVARLERAGAPATIALAQGLGGEVHHACPGALVFTLDCREHRLLPVVEADAPDKYFLLFRDLTNGQQSYGAGRFLYLEPAHQLGAVQLDFNRAFSPPCALTVFAACPVVPRENHLHIAVTAGELAPPSPHTSPAHRR